MTFTSKFYGSSNLFDGGGEIRTHGPVTQTPVFKTGALDHSATPPLFKTRKPLFKMAFLIYQKLNFLLCFFTRAGRCFSFCPLRKIVPSGCLFSLKVFGQRRAGYDGLSLCRKRRS